MHIYNVTFNVEVTSFGECYKWVNEKFIPYVESENLKKTVILQVHSKHSPGTHTFSVQFEAKKKMDILAFQYKKEKGVIADINSKFGEKCILFSTILEVIG